MVTAAVIAPVALGAKWPWMVQFAPTSRVEPQVSAKTKEDASAPVTAMLVIDKDALPVLVKVTYFDTLVVPTLIVPKVRLVADRVIGYVGAKPVPVNATVCGEVAALSSTVMAAVNAPVCVGAKWP